LIQIFHFENSYTDFEIFQFNGFEKKKIFSFKYSVEFS